jgi:tripartite-type tricarboxylate transporter receptor subunit TctC
LVRSVLLALLVLIPLPIPVAAQSEYPNRIVRIVVPAPPGGSADSFGRLIAHYLSQELGQPFVVENRPGGGSRLGLEYVAGSSADGYTLFLGTSSSTSLHLVHKSMRYDVRSALAPIAQIAIVPQALVVNPTVAASTIQQFIELAKKEPDQMNYGSPGVGSAAHMAMELFMNMAGITIQHVHYRGLPQAVADILGGRLSGMMLDTLNAKPPTDAGKMRILGVTTKQRLAAMPEIPTIAESGFPDYEALQWFGLLAPAGTPVPIIQKLQTLVLQAMKTPDLKERLNNISAYHVPTTASEFAALIHNEIEKWNKLAKVVDFQSN